MCIIDSIVIPSNLLISSQGQNFVTLEANFCDELPCLYIKKFQKHTQLEIFFSFDIALCQKMIYLELFRDLYCVTFCDEINFENLKKSPRKHQEGGNLEDSYSHEKFM
jgi:hypothetical protein